MKKINNRLNIETCLALLFPTAICIYLLTRTALPPYGSPLNELSDQVWGLLMDMARKWKAGGFHFWDRAMGGGFSLYSSGYYPILAPGNILAKFLNYDHFFIFKLIEPYFVGLVSTFLLLRNALRLNYGLTFYGSLAYMGFVFARHNVILHQPFHLWACAVFPLLLFSYFKLQNRHIYLRSAVLGAMLALVFAGGGAGQYPTLMIWSFIFLTLDAVVFTKSESFLQKGIQWGISCLTFIFLSFSLLGVQMLPTLFYTLAESSRTSGVYDINNYPIFKKEGHGIPSIAYIFQSSFLMDGHFGTRSFWAFFIFGFGKFIVYFKKFQEFCGRNKALINVWLSSVLFFLIPPTAGMLTDIFPALTPLFNPLRMFTFSYSSYIIDMCLVLFLVSSLSIDGTFVDFKKTTQACKTGTLILFLLIAEIYLLLPIFLSETGLKDWLIATFPTLENFQNIKVGQGQRFLATFALIIFAIPKRRYNVLLLVILLPSLIWLGNRLIYRSFIWGDKGQQTHYALYHFETPEHEYYRSMKGRYFMQYVAGGSAYLYPSMIHNYGLLFEVHGTNGYQNIPPKRFNDFINAYHRNIYWAENTPDSKYSIGLTPPSLITHFPVEFTTVDKDMNLPWPSFSKAVDGEQYDVWVRTTPVERVKFANQIKVVSFRDLIDSFDRPFEGIIYMTEEDFKTYHPKGLVLPSGHKEAAYSNFQVKRQDFWTFDVTTSNDIFVVLPEIYQKGWRLKVDGSTQHVFPANYIFTGFQLSKGAHQIELKFRPPLLTAGLIINVVAMVLLGGIVYVYTRKEKLNGN